MPDMHVAQIWQYPVKSLIGHTVAAATLDTTGIVGLVMLVIAFYFVWRSFYCMRIPEREHGSAGRAH